VFSGFQKYLYQELAAVGAIGRFKKAVEYLIKKITAHFRKSP